MSSKLAIARKLPCPIPDIPVCDEAQMTANFGKYNAPGLSLEEARRIAREELETGVFITTQPERDRWLGKFLAPGRLWDLHAASRVHYSDLAQSAPTGRRAVAISSQTSSSARPACLFYWSIPRRSTFAPSVRTRC